MKYVIHPGLFFALFTVVPVFTPVFSETLRMRRTDLSSAYLYTVPEFYSRHSGQLSVLAKGMTAVREMTGRVSPAVKPAFWIVSSREQMETVLEESFLMQSADLRNQTAQAGVFKDKEKIIMIIHPDTPPGWITRLIFPEYARFLLNAVAPTAAGYNIGWFYAGLSAYNGWRAAALLENKTELQFQNEFRLYFSKFFNPENAFDLASVESPEDWRKAAGQDPVSLYAQSALIYQFLAQKEGDESGVNVLKLYNTESYFEEAFRRVYGFSLNELEAELQQKLYPLVSGLKQQ